MAAFAAPVEHLNKLLDKGVKYAHEQPLIAGAAAISSLICGMFIIHRRSMKRDSNDYASQMSGLKILNNEDHTLKGGEFSTSINEYSDMFMGAREKTGAITSEESVNIRKEKYADMVNHFYNLVTDFYEWGWGQSFHFGPRFCGNNESSQHPSLNR